MTGGEQLTLDDQLNITYRYFPIMSLCNEQICTNVLNFGKNSETIYPLLKLSLFFTFKTFFSFLFSFKL